VADKLSFDLVSPERVLVSAKCDMVVLPGAEGDFGVLVQHAPLVALLRPGVVAVYQGDKVDQRFFVAGGFAEVNAESCILLAEEGFALEDVSKADAERRLDTARRDLADIGEDGPARLRAEEAVAAAEALVEALAA
jgi:F-type H+-transporting ATPase subunit epsilon